MLRLPCTLLVADPDARLTPVALCPSCRCGLCLTHWTEQQHAAGPGGTRLSCEHTAIPLPAVPAVAVRAPAVGGR